jgi:phage virion morphogenesis protein
MVAELKIEIADEQVRTGLERLRIALPGGDMTATMKDIGRALKTGAQLRFRSMKGPDGASWPASFRAKQDGGQTLSLTRRLRNSITFYATRDKVVVGTNVVYAAIHQFGGVIRAKNGPFLAIPITPAARSAGSPRNMPGLHVAQTVKGQFMLVDAKGITQYLLRAQVTMQARPFLGASASDRREVLRILADRLAASYGRDPG